MPVVATNVNANNALRHLNENSSKQGTYLAQLASGKRIERASDDPGGLGVSVALNADVMVLEQLARNAQQGITVLQTADGALARVGDVITRMKALAAQAMNGAMDANARTYLDTEYQLLVAEIDAIANNTEFNGTVLLDGGYTNQQFLLGLDPATAGAILTVSINSMDAGTLGISGDVTDQTNASAEITALDAALVTLSTERATIGANMSQFGFRADVIATSLENVSAAYSAQADADIAEAQTKFTNYETLTTTAIASLAKANELPQELLRLLQ